MACGGSPMRGRKRMADSPQASPHERHTMPASARQPSPISATGLVRNWPRNRARREGPGFSIAASMAGGTGRSQDQLRHPDEKAVAADDPDGDNWPDEGGNDRE